MKWVKLFFWPLLFVSVFGHSQNGLKRDFEIAFQYGNASVAIEKTKSIGFFTAANINKEIALKWLANGAQPTDTVKAIFKNEGILKAFNDAKKGK